MTLLAALLAAQTPSASPIAEFFPLVPGVRRTYEIVTADGKDTMIDEVIAKSVSFEGVPAMGVSQRNGFNQPLGTTFYEVAGSTVYEVGRAEDRSEAVTRSDGTVDFEKPRKHRTVVLALTPRVPVFRYEGKETTWTFGDVPVLKAEGEEPIKTDETAIKGSAKPGPSRTVLGRRVDTVEVRTEVQYGTGKIGQRIVETSLYGRGLGLIESIRKGSGSGGKTQETRTKLIGFEEKRDGG